MDVERYLISKVIGDRDLSPVLDAGITEAFFADKTNRNVFKRLLDLNVKHGQVPTVAMMKKDFPTYRFIEVEEPTDYLINEIQENFVYAVLEDTLYEAVDAFDKEDIENVVSILSSALSRVNSEVSTVHDTNLRTTGAQRLQRYQEMQERDPDEYLGIPMGFDVIDSATQGFQPKQLVTFVGPPKAGKSTIMLLAAIAAWKAGKRVLFIGFEMSNEEQEERADAIVAGINHNLLRGGRGGRLSKKDWRRLEDGIEFLEGGVDFILSNDVRNTLNLSGVSAKCDKYQPDIVFVDGVYMMQDENGEDPGTPRALTNITRGFKRLAQNKVLPFCISTQVLEWKMDKKKGVTSQSIGYTSSFIQDSDVVISVQRTDRGDVNLVKILLGRNVPLGIEVFVKWDWDTGSFEELDYNPFEEPEEGYEGSKF